MPPPSVRATRVAPVSKLFTVTVAPGTDAPVESDTLPETLAPPCAQSDPATAMPIHRRAGDEIALDAVGIVARIMRHHPG